MWLLIALQIGLDDLTESYGYMELIQNKQKNA